MKRPANSALIFFYLALIAACWGSKCRCNKEVTGPADPKTLANAAQQVTSVLIRLIPGTPALPHQLAMVTGSMFEALAFRTGRSQLTGARPEVPTSLSTDALVGYAGYAALNLIFTATNQPDKLKSLDQQMKVIGFKNGKIRDSVGKAFAQEVIKKFPLSMPPAPYQAPNPPSSVPTDATCSSISDPYGWQALCIASGSGDCTPQQVPFLPLVNASLISRSGARDVGKLISNIPPPPMFDGKLTKLPLKGGPRFLREYLKVLKASAKLGDEDKTVAEVFAPNAALAVHNLVLDEAATRKLNLDDSATLLFSVSAAVRDGFIGSSTIKVIYSTIRPITLLQCAFRGRTIRAWAGPYRGVQSFRNTKEMPWRPYIQTPPFPGYISGHTTVSGAAAEILRRFFKSDKPKAANCFVRMPGESNREPQIGRGEEGFIPGVTNVPNKGLKTKGFVPAKKVTVCWRTWKEYADLVAKSRLTGGVHTPLENQQGLKLGKKAASQVFKFVQKK